MTEKYIMGILMPATVLFSAFFFLAVIYQFCVFVRGRTHYPKWAAIFNVMFGIVISYLVGGLIGTNIVGNAVTTGAISFGNIWMFGGLLLCKRREKSPDRAK